MESTTTDEWLSIPADQISYRQIRVQLTTAYFDQSLPLPKLLLSGCHGQHNVLPAWNLTHTVVCEGDCGNYAAAACDSCDVEIKGNVGQACGQSLNSGSIIVHGHAGDSFGCMGRSGLIASYGNVGRRVASANRGADILVRGSVGSQAAYGMSSGTLIIGANAGHGMGDQMTGGIIYLRGDVESIASCIREVRMREPERMRLGLILLKAGIKTTNRDFRVFRCEAS